MSAYLRCAHSFAALVDAVPADGWDRPGLGTWSVRTLVGHLGRSLDTVVTYVGAPEPDTVNTPTAEDYYLTLTAADGPLAPGGDASGVDARAIAAGQALGERPAAAIAAKIIDATRVLDAAPADRRVEVILGITMPLPEYLRTRVFELVVHGIDLSRAIGVGHDLPSAAVADMTRMATSLAISTGRSEQLLLALTGRAPLPAGFSVV